VLSSAGVQPTLEAIVEPRRREILRLLHDEEMTAGRVASHFDVTRPAISHHLSVLRGAGLVTERREGTKRIYRARPEGLAELRAYLEPFWSERLEALKRETEAYERRNPGGRGRRRHSR
jgi:DNA-binding transcriptional ArsR family regulator